MATGRLTKRTVDALQAAPKDQFLWDDDLAGFGLKVTPAGNKVYLFQYRLGGRGAATRRMTLGRHGSPWTPAGARAEADRLLVLVKQGKDPASDKEDRQRMATELAFDSYADRFLADYGKKAWRTATFNGAKSSMRRFVTPMLKKKPLPLIRRSDVVTIFDKLPAGNPALPRNVFALVRKLFAWAVERGDIDRSPLEGFKGPSSVPSRDRVLTDDELRLVWLGADKLGAPFGSLIQLLLATGQRREEASAIRWSELDRGHRVWVIPASRAKNNKEHLVPLNELSIAILDAAAGGEVWPRKGLIFTTTGKTPVSGYSRAKSRLDREMTKLNSNEAVEPWRLHDLRRTLATGFQRLGVRFEVTEAVLNHVSGSKSGVAGVYQRHDWKKEKTDALAAWASHVEGVVAGPENSNVITLADRRA